MRSLKLAALLLVCMFLTSCLLRSIHPWYDKKDIIFEPKLLGTWQDVDPDGIGEMIFERDSKNPDTYIVKFPYNQKGSPATAFEACLTKIKDNFYLDIWPRVDDWEDNDIRLAYYFPTHGLTKLVFTDTGIKIIEPITTTKLDPSTVESSDEIKTESYDPVHQETKVRVQKRFSFGWGPSELEKIIKKELDYITVEDFVITTSPTKKLRRFIEKNHKKIFIEDKTHTSYLTKVK